MHRNVATVVAAAREVGLEIEPREFPEGTRTAEDAARAIGVAVAQIVKSLVFTVDDRPVMALVSGSNQLDETKLGTAAGGSRARRADADTVRRATGFPVGGVPPLGHRLAVFVDRDLLAFDTVWAAAGTPQVVFAVAPAVLVEATGAAVSDLAK
jgi:prolyl-tRNA editing enzyme YbaK/EbsC (Cys-tRNA(Pro) deacylase)